MQNFGRGMWRRVGDYERIQRNIIQQSRFEQFIKHQALLKAQQQEYDKTQKQLNVKPIDTIITNKNNHEPIYKHSWHDETHSNEHIEYY